jgi:hypothetical protein
MNEREETDYYEIDGKTVEVVVTYDDDAPEEDVHYAITVDGVLVAENFISPSVTPFEEYYIREMIGAQD